MRLFKRYYLVVLAFMLISLTSCAMTVKEHWPAIEGKVTEEGTNKPIEGAIVVVSYKGWGAYSTGNCFHVEVATTDENGIYRIPAWRNTGKWNNLNNQTQYVTAYKDGYDGTFRAENSFNHILLPYYGTREERLGYLKRIEEATRCNVESERLKVRSPLITKLYEEAKEIASTKQDYRIVDSLFYVLESMEIGDEQALKNLVERRNNRGE